MINVENPKFSPIQMSITNHRIKNNKHQYLLSNRWTDASSVKDPSLIQAYISSNHMAALQQECLLLKTACMNFEFPKKLQKEYQESINHLVANKLALATLPASLPTTFPYNRALYDGSFTEHDDMPHKILGCM